MNTYKPKYLAADLINGLVHNIEQYNSDDKMNMLKSIMKHSMAIVSFRGIMEAIGVDVDWVWESTLEYQKKVIDDYISDIRTKYLKFPLIVKSISPNLYKLFVSIDKWYDNFDHTMDNTYKKEDITDEDEQYELYNDEMEHYRYSICENLEDGSELFVEDKKIWSRFIFEIRRD